jgi:tetratricopeptide (TPR) repeat protein
MRLCGSVFAGLPPRNGPNPSPPSPEFHLRPHYRAQRSLDATLLKANAARDDFVTERYAERLNAVLSTWSASLVHSPQDLSTIAKGMSADFAATSLRPSQSKLVRSDPHLEIRRHQFAPEASLGRDAFLRDLQSMLRPFSRLVTAEFQLTSIDAAARSDSRSDGPSRIKTRVRYDLVGPGEGLHVAQRSGNWDLEWEPSSSGEYRLRTWRQLDETDSRAAAPVFACMTESALGGNASYRAQLLHGADYWRTVLDGACGIDIYGHNGVSVGDIDNDGFDDLYVCQPAGLPNRLYRNRGDGTFEDITERSGAGVLENTACALFVDVNNDGRQDLIVVDTDGPLLFLNEGRGKFRHKPDAFHFANPPQGTFTGASVADYDRDGWLDIYFCLYVYYQGTDQYKYPCPYHDAENGPPNFMMRNNRDGSFRDVTAETGLDQNNTRYSFCCAWNDYNHDGWPDLYVVNDFGRKNLYRNNGDGTFTDVAAEAGVEDTGAGMSACWFDYDNDGAEDLYVANMWTAAGQRVATQEIFQKSLPEKVRALYRKHAMGNSLFRNRSTTTGFQDATATASVEMGRWSWSSDAWDFDHDGYPDLYVTNGMVSGPSPDDLNGFFWRQVVAKSPADAAPSHAYEQGWNAINELIRADGTWSGYERNVFYANNRDGTFSEVSGAMGLDFIEDGRSFALADIDHDGRLEVFLKNRSAPQLRLLRNVIENLPPSVSFRLEGTKSNRDAIGAVITVETRAGRQTRVLEAGSGFLSQHSKEVFFGLGELEGPVRAWIRWPSGAEQELRDLPVNHRVWVEEGSAEPRLEAFKTAATVQTPPFTPASQESERLPATVETWLLAPVAAPEVSLPELTGARWTLSAQRGRTVLLNFWVAAAEACRQDLVSFQRHYAAWTARGLQVVALNVDESDAAGKLETLARAQSYLFPILRGSEDVASVYNLLYRQLFDRHRDLSLPTSFLIDRNGDIVKVYQGPVNPEHLEHDAFHIPQTLADRLSKALPFTGVTSVSEFSRNYLSYGSVFFQQGYYDQAESWFRRAIEEDPSSAEALYGMGSVYLEKQKNDEARAAFERVTKLHSSYPDTVPNAWNNLGLLATREGRFSESVELFNRALRISPDHLIALENLGNAYRQLKQWENARKTLERAVEVGPDDPEAHYSLGMVFAQLDETDRAYDCLERALKLRPTYPEALNNLGVLYLRTGRRDQAVASFEESIRVAPAFDQSYLNLARVYALEGQPDRARTILLDLLQQHPDHVQAQKALEELPR